MANTLKFGNGQWATKVGSTLAYNDENGNFKPLPFNFTRSTGGTRVNKDGLIEMVTNNKPRIDFLNDSNGALLLEPQRSNLITQSELFSDAYWTKSGASVVSGFTSPDGTDNAYKMTEDSATSVHKISNNSAIANSFQSQSIFIKYDSSQQFIQTTSSRSINNYVNFDILNKTLTNYGTSVGKIVELSSGWLRLEVYHDSSTTAYWHFITSLTASWSESYLGTGKHLLIFGAQVEAGSYATSYIPTQGSAVTRIADSCSQTPPSGIIGQTEGTMFIEFDAEEDAPQNMNLINFNNSTQASVLIAKKTSGELRAQVFAGGSALVDINSAIVSGKTKAAIAYKSGDSVLYVNGVGVSDSSTFTFNGTLSDVIFPSHQAYFNYGHKYSVNQALLFKTRLTNAELQSLTQI
jgi:hypothetical protein